MPEATQEKPVTEITMTRNAGASGKFAGRGEVLKVGTDISKNDARQLLRSGKALPGKATRVIEAVAAEKKATKPADK